MNENELYSFVENEVRDGIYDEVLWQKAMDDNNGEFLKAETEYIELRVAQLKQEEVLQQTVDPTENETIASKKSPNRRNIFIGIVVLFMLVVAIVFIAYLLHDYFN